jgi:hypothetical protein
MTPMTATEARNLLYKRLDDVADSHEPIQITGKRACGPHCRGRLTGREEPAAAGLKP